MRECYRTCLTALLVMSTYNVSCAPIVNLLQFNALLYFVQYVHWLCDHFLQDEISTLDRRLIGKLRK